MCSNFLYREHRWFLIGYYNAHGCFEQKLARIAQEQGGLVCIEVCNGLIPSGSGRLPDQQKEVPHAEYKQWQITWDVGYLKHIVPDVPVIGGLMLVKHPEQPPEDVGFSIELGAYPPDQLAYAVGLAKITYLNKGQRKALDQLLVYCSISGMSVADVFSRHPRFEMLYNGNGQAYKEIRTGLREAKGRIIELMAGRIIEEASGVKPWIGVQYEWEPSKPEQEEMNCFERLRNDIDLLVPMDVRRFCSEVLGPEGSLAANGYKVTCNIESMM